MTFPLYIASVDYELKYGDVINAGNVVVAVKGIGNYKDSIEGSYEISKASIASFIPEIKTIEINVLKYVENKAVLNTIGDIDISGYVVSGYGYLVFSSEYNLTEAIYYISYLICYYFLKIIFTICFIIIELKSTVLIIIACKLFYYTI